MTKIKSISIKGIRGIQEQLTLELDQKSLLIFGENGSGKSSITDAIEWFYNNRVKHLSNEEIGRGGLDALRNIFLNENLEAFAEFKFSDEKLDSRKTIYYKKESIQSQYSNQNFVLNQYLEKTLKENIILRYQDITQTVLATKREKLDILLEVIGFQVVIKVRDILRKAVYAVRNEYKKSNFDNLINIHQFKILERIGSNIHTDIQFVETINKLITPLELGIKIEKIDEVDTLLSKFKLKKDSRNLEFQTYYDNISDFFVNLSPALNIIEDLYKKFNEHFKKVINDIHQLNMILLEKLLEEGIKVIRANASSPNECPLCKQYKPLNELYRELEIRINDLQEVKIEKRKFDDLKHLLRKEIEEINSKINFHLSKNITQIEENQELKERIIQLKNELAEYSSQLSIELLPGSELKKNEELLFDKKNINWVGSFCKQKLEFLRDENKENPELDIQNNILLSREAYRNIKQLKKEKEILEGQQKSLEIIYNDFLEKQKQNTELFLSKFSNNINEYYTFMNPDENIHSIKLIPIEKDEGLVGLTLEFEFYKKKETPPQKYLSESHINCLGLAFFLTSVRAFNTTNKFFILDDVISSFDAVHRKRFADLLIEKFSDYQIILLTHENSFFELMRYLAKRNNWIINTVKWHNKKGTYIDEPLKFRKEKIVSKIEAGETDGLGTDIRKYIEHMLKNLVYNLRLKMLFQFNDKNEERMSGEMFDVLESQLKNNELIELDEFKRLKSSMYWGNKNSHDSNLYDASLGDLKAFWLETTTFEGLVICNNCNSYISSEKNLLKCRCGQKLYNYKPQGKKKTKSA